MSDLTAIWNNFRSELRYAVLKKVKDENDADDIIQDAFLKISQNIDKVNQAKNMRQYLFAIVRNTVADHYRSLRYHLPIDKLANEPAENDEVDFNATVAECCVRPFVKQLPEKYREALLLSEIDEVPQKELAERLNISYSGAKSRVQRGREKLKEMILGCCAYQVDNYGNLAKKNDTDCSCPS